MLLLLGSGLTVGANTPEARPEELCTTDLLCTHVDFCSLASVCVHAYVHACMFKEQGCYLQPQSSLSCGQQRYA